jgi:hypothetical protein
MLFKLLSTLPEPFGRIAWYAIWYCGWVIAAWVIMAIVDYPNVAGAMTLGLLLAVLTNPR